MSPSSAGARYPRVRRTHHVPRTLVKVLESKYCINQSEVYATGFSGARESEPTCLRRIPSLRRGCAISGLRRPKPCPTSRAVPSLPFTVPLTRSIPSWATTDVLDLLGSDRGKDWARQDDCSLKPVTSRLSGGVTLTSYSHCADGSAVQLYEVTGEGHEWPGGPVMPSSLTAELGPQANAIDANAEMWAFFKAHPLAG